MITLKVVNTGSERGNCYLLSSDTQTIVLDCGCKFHDILKALGYDLCHVSAVLITHVHKDHSLSAKDFVKHGIPVYCNKECKEDLGLKDLEVLSERVAVYIGDFRIVPFSVPHDGTWNYAFLISHNEMGKLIYATDFEYIPFRFKGMCVEHFLIECNHQNKYIDASEGKFSHSVRGHSELETVKEVIKANKTRFLRNIILCHMSESASDPIEMLKEIQNVAGYSVNVDLAAQGLEIILDLPEEGEKVDEYL